MVKAIEVEVIEPGSWPQVEHHPAADADVIDAEAVPVGEGPGQDAPPVGQGADPPPADAFAQARPQHPPAEPPRGGINPRVVAQIGRVRRWPRAFF